MSKQVFTVSDFPDCQPQPGITTIRHLLLTRIPQVSNEPSVNRVANTNMIKDGNKAAQMIEKIRFTGWADTALALVLVLSVAVGTASAKSATTSATHKKRAHV